MTNQEKTLVSICCLVYNHEKYLKKCLDGFMMQKCNFKYEVLVHDDASSDKSTNIIREYENRYPNIIKPIFQSKNQYSKGINSILFNLIRKTEGEYIALCEGDDYWIDEKKLQKQYDAICKSKDIGICVHGVDAITEDGNIKDRHYPDLKWIRPGIIKGDTLVKIACLGRYEFQTSSYFFRKDLLNPLLNKKNTFFDGAISGDTPLLLYYGQCSNGYYIKDTMSHYRHGSTTSKTEKEKYTNNKKEYSIHYKHQIDMMNEYDKYTEYKYHKYCKAKIDAYDFMAAWSFEDYKAMAKVKNWKFMRLDSFGIKGITKVFIGALWPKLLHFIEEKKNEQ